MNRKWITIDRLKDLCYWSCPNSKCKEVVWNYPLETEITCYKCKYKYEAVQIEGTRLLIETRNS